MENYPKPPYSIIVDFHTYSVHEKVKNKFFVVHVTPHGQGTTQAETGIFEWMPNQGMWADADGSTISQKHTPEILKEIRSRMH